MSLKNNQIVPALANLEIFPILIGAWNDCPDSATFILNRSRTMMCGSTGFTPVYPSINGVKPPAVTAFANTTARRSNPSELFTTKSGDEIIGQLYNFVDKGDRAVSLRPEMTPTLARMIAAHERNY